MTYTEVTNAVAVNQETDTNLASVAATASSPARAAAIANHYAANVIAVRQQQDGAYYANALRAVRLQLDALAPAERRGAQGTDLQDRAESLQILSQLQGSDVQLAQAATAPTSPSSPKVARNTAIGAILGLVLGVLLAYALERFDRRLRDPSDLEAVYGAPMLGVVPESRILGAEADATGTSLALPAEEAEIFSLLRAHIRYFNVDQQLRIMTVVSAAQGDGKTTIARNLALASATMGSRVLFIESDLRRPSATRHFGLDTGTGLSDVLVDGRSLEDAVQTVEFPDRGQQRFSVDVLLAGTVLPPNPAQVLESQTMERLLADARDRYDLVIIDTPPLALVSDAFPLMRASDGVLIVSRLGRNRRDVAARLRQTLESADATVIGVVANGYRRKDAAGYGYQYSYYGQTSQSQEASTAQVSANGATQPETDRERAPVTRR